MPVISHEYKKRPGSVYVKWNISMVIYDTADIPCQTSGDRNNSEVMILIPIGTLGSNVICMYTHMKISLFHI
jgi:hypothetical protein